MTLPRLSDVEPVRVKFSPGDRVLVRVSSNLHDDQRTRLTRSVEKFAGCSVRVLIVNCLSDRILWDKRDGQGWQVLVEPKKIPDAVVPGVANVDCSVVALKSNDRLLVSNPLVRQAPLKLLVERWAGPDVEVIVNSPSR